MLHPSAKTYITFPRAFTKIGFQEKILKKLESLFSRRRVPSVRAPIAITLCQQLWDLGPAGFHPLKYVKTMKCSCLSTTLDFGSWRRSALLSRENKNNFLQNSGIPITAERSAVKKPFHTTRPATDDRQTVSNHLVNIVGHLAVTLKKQTFALRFHEDQKKVEKNYFVLAIMRWLEICIC